MKIYTRKGDGGETSLIGGVRVPKHHIRIEAYGTVDELNSAIGVVRDLYPEDHAQTMLLKIQHTLFDIGSHLAAHPEKSKMKLPEIQSTEIALMESEMDRMNDVLPELTHFILPGGAVAASHAHVARCICRRAERCTVHLAESEPVESLVLQYLNRLSDYLFVLSRMIVHDSGGTEIRWNA